MRQLIVGSLVLALALASPTSDLAHKRCDGDYASGWPNELADAVLVWTSNERADLAGPKFRLFSDVDVRIVEPGTDYKLSLRPLDETAKLSRFLISIEQDQVLNGQSHIQDEDCFDAGMLKSLSDESEHLSYGCFRYLVERSDLDKDNLVEIPFEWRSPECGCTEISAEILDTENKIYAKDNDRFLALSVKACVRTDETGKAAAGEGHDDRKAEDVYRRIGEWYREDDDDDDILRDGDNDVTVDDAEPLPVPGALVQDDANDDGDDDDDAADNVVDVKSEDAKAEKEQKKGKARGKKTEEQKKERRARRKNRRQNRKRRGKKICCKKGVQVKLESGDLDVCKQVPEETVTKAVQTFGLRTEVCDRVFRLCCEDEIIGEEKLSKLSRKNRQSRRERKERRKKKKMENNKSNKMPTEEDPEQDQSQV